MSEHILVDDGPALQTSGLVHRVHQPTGQGPHRTLVLLHGLGGDEDVMWIFARTVPSSDDWLTIAPRGIGPGPDGSGNSWHRWQGGGWPSWAAFDEAAERLAQFIASLPGLYGADPQEVYLAGFSQGAATSVGVAIRQPGVARGVATLMGFVPQDTPRDRAATALAGLPIFMAAGRQDATIPLEVSRASADIVREAGAQLDYREYNTGHKMNAEAMEDLRQWWRGIT
jgi:predicted esterase